MRVLWIFLGAATLVTLYTTLLNYATSHDVEHQSRDGSTASITAVTSQKPPKMLAFHSAYCPACRTMEPVVDELTDDCSNKGISIKTVDLTDEGNEIMAIQHSVSVLPTYLFLAQDGKETERLLGRQTAAELYRAVGDLRGQKCTTQAPPGRSG